MRDNTCAWKKFLKNRSSQIIMQIVSLDRIGEVIQNRMLFEIRKGINLYYEKADQIPYNKTVYETSQVDEYKRIVSEDKIIELLQEYNSESSYYELVHVMDRKSLKIILQRKKDPPTTTTVDLTIQAKKTEDALDALLKLQTPIPEIKRTKIIQEDESDIPIPELSANVVPADSCIFMMDETGIKDSWGHQDIEKLKKCISAYVNSSRYPIDVGRQDKNIKRANEAINAYGLWLKKKKKSKTKLTPELLHGKHASKILPLFLDEKYFDV